MSDIKDELPKSVLDCLEEIVFVATSTDGTEAELRGQIVRLAHHAELLIGYPTE